MLAQEFEMTVRAIQTGQLSTEDPKTCACRGGGWILTDFDTWHECPLHHRKGMAHPEDCYPTPWLRVTVEHTDGSPYSGVIGFEPDGDRIENNGPLYNLPETEKDDLEKARGVARRLRDQIGRYQAKGYIAAKDIRVRLARVWVD